MIQNVSGGQHPARVNGDRAPLGSCVFPAVALMVTFQLQEPWVLALSQRSATVPSSS